MSDAGASVWYIRSEAGSVYGPAKLASLVAWAEEGRIEPSGFVSRDRHEWIPAPQLAELQMKWLVETEPGKIFGPFNRAVVIRLFKEGAPAGAKAYRLHELPVDEDEPPRIVEKIVEKVVVKEVPVAVEKTVEAVAPAQTALIVPEVVEPVAERPSQLAPRGLFKGLDRACLQALEQAAQAELARTKHGFFSRGFFGGRK